MVKYDGRKMHVHIPALLFEAADNGEVNAQALLESNRQAPAA